jgi:hypothetical protein
MRMLLLLGVLGALLAGTTPGRSATVTSGDGLRIELDDGSGSVVAVAANGVLLPFLPDAHGLVSLKLGRPVPTGQLLSLPFEGDDESWTSARNADWDAPGPYATRVEDGGIDGSDHLLLGHGSTEGAVGGIAWDDPVHVVGTLTPSGDGLAQTACIDDGDLEVAVIDIAGLRASRWELH